MKATDWWAWDGESLFYLGSHEAIEDAYEVDDKREGPSSNWVFSRESLLHMREEINYALETR